MHIADHDIADLHRGFTREDDAIRCLFCDTNFEQGVVYPVGECLLDAGRAARDHVATAHGGVVAALLALGKDVTGLSDVQAQVLGLVAQGVTDADIAKALGGRSASTVRNHRFQLRRRHREAKVFVAMMDLVQTQDFVQFHATLPVSDDRTVVTTTEAETLLDKYFEDRARLLRFPKKEKHKLVVLRQLVERFEHGRRYTEKQVNALLAEAYADYAVLRRYLVDYGFMARTASGSAYWRTDG